jgi:hypothetical protein
MEEAQEAPDVVISMFFVNITSVVVLFDYGASHSFISIAYIEKHNLPLVLLGCQIIVSSPGGDMPARQLCPKVNLKIRGVDFVANLIVLESKGIDGIHGMVRENVRVMQSRQKSYVEHRRRELCLEVGDFIYLDMSPMRGLRRFTV